MVLLRNLRVSDLDFLTEIENNPVNLAYGDYHPPFAKETLLAFIQTSATSLMVNNQYRFVIEYCKNPVGFLDLFKYQPALKGASVGIIIDAPFRNKGLGYDSLLKLETVAVQLWGLSCLQACVAIDNLASISLFNKLGYTTLDVKENYKLGLGCKSVVRYKKQLYEL